MNDVTAAVQERLNTILANVKQNLTQTDNQIAQGQQQLEVAIEQREAIKVLVATLQHVIDAEAFEAVAVIAADNEAVAVAVASSPSEPAAAAA